MGLISKSVYGMIRGYGWYYGEDLSDELKKLIYEYKLHRIKWRMIGGNPVEKNYDKFCDKFGGTKHVLREVIKDKYGNHHDDIIYEIVNQWIACFKVRRRIKIYGRS